MDIIYNTVIATSLYGFLTGWMGMLAGIICSFFIKGKGRRLKGTIIGFIGGLMLAIVFFDLIPESLEAGSIYISMLGILFGLILSVLIDGRLDDGNLSSIHIPKNTYLKAAIFMAIGIGIHNIPSGVALGSLLSADPLKAVHLSIALIIHGIPEGLAIGLFFRESNVSSIVLVFVSILISIPMGLGSLIGGIISGISPVISSISIAFAAGMILYVTCRETLPSARDTWGGRLSAVGNILGIIAGILLISLLQNITR